MTQKTPPTSAAARRSVAPRIVVCADDYGLTPGVSGGIRELIAAGRITATSVMTLSQAWPAEAGALRAIAGSADIGLHLTLTDQSPLGPMPRLAPQGRLPPLAWLMAAAVARRLPLDEIAAEAERQLAAFVAHYGAPPAHIDGHHHTHQLPGIRDIVVALAQRTGAGDTWVRICAEPVGRLYRRGIAPLKAGLIASFGAATARRAAAAGVPTNHGFSGVYDYSGERRPLAELFARFLDGAGDGHLVMCHPGYVDADLAGRDSLVEGREAERAFLAGPEWLRVVAAKGVVLSPLPRPART